MKQDDFSLFNIQKDQDEIVLFEESEESKEICKQVKEINNIFDEIRGIVK